MKIIILLVTLVVIQTQSWPLSSEELGEVHESSLSASQDLEDGDLTKDFLRRRPNRFSNFYRPSRPSSRPSRPTFSSNPFAAYWQQVLANYPLYSSILNGRPGCSRPNGSNGGTNPEVPSTDDGTGTPELPVVNPTIPNPQPPVVNPTIPNTQPPVVNPTIPNPQPPVLNPTMPNPQPPVVNPTIPNPQPPVVNPTIPNPQPPVVNPTIPNTQPPVVNPTIPNPQPSVPAPGSQIPFPGPAPGSQTPVPAPGPETLVPGPQAPVTAPESTAGNSITEFADFAPALPISTPIEEAELKETNTEVEEESQQIIIDDREPKDQLPEQIIVPDEPKPIIQENVVGNSEQSAELAAAGREKIPTGIIPEEDNQQMLILDQLP